VTLSGLHIANILVFVMIPMVSCKQELNVGNSHIAYSSTHVCHSSQHQQEAKEEQAEECHKVIIQEPLSLRDVAKMASCHVQ